MFPVNTIIAWIITIIINMNMLINHFIIASRAYSQQYMRASKEGANWIHVGYTNEHYGHGDGVVMIEFFELFQLYQQEALDKSILSAYCL